MRFTKKEPGVSIIETNCTAKAIMVGATSYVFGIGMGAFMHMHQTEMADYSSGRGTRTQTKVIWRDYVKKCKSTARGFVVFGILYSVFDCQ